MRGDPREPDPVDDAPSGRPQRPGRNLFLFVAVLAAVVLPLFMAAGVLRDPTPYANSDIAQTELKIRDVGGSHPPLTGLGGRIGPPGQPGSHPGPLSFWTIAVFYRLLGSSPWALVLATATLNAIALGLTLWMARRRGGGVVMLGVAATLLILVQAYGGYVLTLPWNPYLPILWWITTLVAVWSILSGDLKMLPVVVFAGSFCMQTHISYLGIVAGVLALAASATAYWTYRRRGTAAMRSGMVWLAVAAALGAVVWFPPVAEQVTGSQGHNLTIIAKHFSHPPEKPVGFGTGADLLLGSLNPRALLTEPVVEGRLFLGGPTAPGRNLLVAWVIALGVAASLRHWALLRLHFVLALALMTGLVSVSRIFGPPWNYLALWAWGTSALILFAVAWTAAAFAARLLAATAGSRSERPARVGTAALAALVLVLAIRATVDADDTELFQPELAVSTAAVIVPAVRALKADAIPGTGPHGRYFVTFDDPWYGGARGFALVNELDRAGLDAHVSEGLAYAVGRHRLIDPTDATAQVHLAVGPEIERWETLPGAKRLSYDDPASPEGRATYERLRRSVLDELAKRGVDDGATLIDRTPTALLDGRLSDKGTDRVARMLELGQPAAVFVAPPETPG